MNKLTKNQIKYKRKKIKDKLRKNNNNRCPSCGSDFNLQLSHIIPVSQNKSLEPNEDNCLLDCHECHYTWEHRHANWNKAYLNINNFMDRYARMKVLDYNFYRRDLIRVPDWLRVKIEKYNVDL